MAYTSLSNSVEKMRNLQPFTGNSLWGQRVGEGNGEGYEVYSYSTLMARVNSKGELEYLDLRRWSNTTSKHQSRIKEAFRLFPEANGATILNRK